jgi:hypothetical protein
MNYPAGGETPQPRFEYEPTSMEILADKVKALDYARTTYNIAARYMFDRPTLGAKAEADNVGVRVLGPAFKETLLAITETSDVLDLEDQSIMMAGLYLSEIQASNDLQHRLIPTNNPYWWQSRDRAVDGQQFIQDWASLTHDALAAASNQTEVEQVVSELAQQHLYTLGLDTKNLLGAARAKQHGLGKLAGIVSEYAPEIAGLTAAGAGLGWLTVRHLLGRRAADS